jgi:hypothetical protein
MSEGERARGKKRALAGQLAIMRIAVREGISTWVCVYVRLLGTRM